MIKAQAPIYPFTTNYSEIINNRLPVNANPGGISMPVAGCKDYGNARENILYI